MDIWLDALDTRNATVHDYFDAAPDDYMKVIKNFSRDAESVLEKVSSLAIPAQAKK